MYFGIPKIKCFVKTAYNYSSRDISRRIDVQNTLTCSVNLIILGKGRDRKYSHISIKLQVFPSIIITFIPMCVSNIILLKQYLRHRIKRISKDTLSKTCKRYKHTGYVQYSSAGKHVLTLSDKRENEISCTIQPNAVGDKF